MTIRFLTVVLVTAVILLTVMFAGAGYASDHNKKEKSGDFEAGATLAQKHQCLQCHGVLTNQFNPRLPHLAGQNPRYLQKQLRAFQSMEPAVIEGGQLSERHSHIMEGRAMVLNNEEVRELAAYFSARQCRPPERNVSTPPPPQIEKCAVCHGKEGRTALADYPNLAGQKRAYLELQLGYFSGLKKRSDGRPGRFHEVMSSMALDLSYGEIFEIASYYANQSCR